MRTSLNEIKAIDAYLQGKLCVSDRFLFEARMILDKELRKNVAWQQKAYTLIRIHHREASKRRLQVLHRRLFHDPANAELKKQIVKLFTS